MHLCFPFRKGFYTCSNKPYIFSLACKVTASVSCLTFKSQSVLVFLLFELHLFGAVKQYCWQKHQMLQGVSLEMAHVLVITSALTHTVELLL